LPDLHAGGEGKSEGRGLSLCRGRLKGSRPSRVALSIDGDFVVVARVRRQPLDNGFEWASRAFCSRVGDCCNLPFATFGRIGVVGMIGILACGLGRGEHPQGHPIGLNGPDEWTGDSVRDWIEGAKWEQKEGNQQWFFHIFLNCHLVFMFLAGKNLANSVLTEEYLGGDARFFHSLGSRSW
jgi:hypothetical protein